MLFNNFVISPPDHLKPSFRISPFTTKDVVKNRKLKGQENFKIYFSKRFPSSKIVVSFSGRKAIHSILKKLQIKKNDVVTILTTSNNFYISSCVTKEIEKFCRWSRNIEKNTKLIFVNHEFGFPYEKLLDLKKYNLPIIEDCAHSFNSINLEGTLGQVGDYVIFSFPKFFPIQLGAVVIVNGHNFLEEQIDELTKMYIKNVVGFYLQNLNEISLARLNNYKYLAKKIEKLGLNLRFQLNGNNYIPGVFMFELWDNYSAIELKKLFVSNGIEASVFYKENSFFIPVHQNLKKNELDFFINLIKYFIDTKDSNDIL